MASCYNSDKEFPDFEGGTTAYFAYQDPVRTLILGSDIYDNTLDNDHKCKIYATMGGAYKGRDAVADIVVDNSLCDYLFFVDKDGNAAGSVLPMPSTHYKLASNTINYGGDMRGAVEVQFTDQFFSDPKSIENTYVIPLVMKSIRGIDHILTGTKRESVDNPLRTNPNDWDELPKDYVLYCVKYINPWHAKYIRRGVDNVTEGTKTATYVRQDFSLINTDPGRYTENPVNANDEVCGITTINMTQAKFPAIIKTSGASKTCNLILTFNGNKCTITSADDDVEVTGEGEYISKGTELPAYKDFKWGEISGRDILRLSYKANFNNGKIISETNDTLVMQTRESNKKEFFDPKFVKN